MAPNQKILQHGYKKSLKDFHMNVIYNVSPASICNFTAVASLAHCYPRKTNRTSIDLDGYQYIEAGMTLFTRTNRFQW